MNLEYSVRSRKSAQAIDAPGASIACIPLSHSTSLSSLRLTVFIWLLTVIILLFSFTPVLHAEEAVSTVSTPSIENKIKEIKDATGIDEESKAKLIDRYQKTLGFLEAEKKNNAAAINYLGAINKTPEKILKIREELEKQASSKTTPVIGKTTEKSSLAELEQRLLSEKANLATVQSKHNELKQKLAEGSQRATKVRDRLTEINQQLLQITADAELLLVDQDIKLKQASELLNKAHIAALQSEIKSLDQELLSQPIRLEHMNAQYELTSHKLKSFSNTITQFEESVNLKRDSQAQEAIKKSRQAKQKAIGKHTLIQQVAERNEELSEDISKVSNKLSRLTNEKDKLDKLTKRIRTEFNSAKMKLEVAGLSHSLGQLLLEQKKNLPDEYQFEKKTKSHKVQIVKTSLLHFQHKDELLQISDTNDYLEGLIEPLTNEEGQSIRLDLESLAIDRKSLLEKITDIEFTYIRTLDDMNFDENNLQIIVLSYNTFLDKQLFWMRSSSVLSWDNIKNIPEHLLRFLSKKHWRNVYSSFISSLQNSYTSAYLFALILLLRSRHTKRLIKYTGTKLGEISTDKFSYTFKVLFYTLELSLPWPLIVALTGYQLKLSSDPSAYTQAVSVSLIWVAIPLFHLVLFRNICLLGGLADTHFKWQASITQDLRKAIGRLMIIFLPALFISMIIFNQGIESPHIEASRLILIVTLAAFCLFFYRLFKQERGILTPFISENTDHFFSRYHHLWPMLVYIISFGFLILILTGYVYTAAFLIRKLIVTFWFVTTLIIIHQFILRWLLLNHRKLALKEAIKHRQTAQTLSETQEKKDKTELPDNIEFVEPEIDLISLSKDSNKFLKITLIIIGFFALAGIWSEVLPALSIFNDISLWYHTELVNGEEKILPVTLGDAGLGLLIVLLTIISTRNLPSIIELILLQRPSISSSGRYTIKTLTNYTIIGIGTFSALNILGAEWAKFQWLLAALSVGIGFGLQEIVANFISGLIILFERPIRVGDYVSVGENEGIVSRIQIRATTIQTLDRKELLVPNKEFITGQLLNWSLSDTTTRLIIPVSVSYGSDIPKARELLMQAAVKHERVITEPAPQVLFYGFGDNTLDLQLRCFIADVSYKLSTISDINEEINHMFNTAGINFAFPQRDVHLDIKDPIDVRLHK